MVSKAEIRVVVADDHPAFRDGVCRRLSRETGISVVGEADSGPAALQLIRATLPEVVLLDLEMPGMNGVEVTQALAEENSAAHVLILSAYEDEEVIAAVIDAGAAGYMSKEAPLAKIVEAVRGVAAGQTGWLSRRIAAVYMSRNRRPNGHQLAYLSERELEVVQRIAQGDSNSEIGARLFISEHTVKKHATSIFEKLGVKTRAQVIVWMWKHGLVTPEE
jgi:DNA-binding NarL/FixJ family response regulator